MSTQCESCPIALHCASTFLELSRNELTHGIFHLDNEDEWDDLKQRARESTPSQESKWLRAFYALEVIYHHILPRLFFTVNDARTQSLFLNLRAGRSVEGLNDLIDICEKYEQRASAKRTMVAIKDSGADNSSQLIDVLAKQLLIVTALSVSAKTLKTCLRHRTTIGLQNIGAELGKAFHLSGVSDEVVQTHVETILKITPNNAATPWNQHSQNQKTSLG